MLNIKFLRGTEAENDLYTGEDGIITVDVTKRTIRLHDGITAGGHKIAKVEDILSEQEIKELFSDVALSGEYDDLVNAPGVVTALVNGLMDRYDKIKLDTIQEGAQVNPSTTASRTNSSSEVVLQAKAMNDHRTSSDHDSRYYTKTEVDSSLSDKLNVSLKGAVSGLAELDSNGKIPLSQLSDSVLGQVEYMGTWNAKENNPTLPEFPTKKGDYYVVSWAGTFNEIDFEVGDWIISNGVSWERVANTDAVSTVNGRGGNVVITKEDVDLGEVPNVDTSNADNITTGTLHVDRLPTTVVYDNDSRLTNSREWSESTVGQVEAETGTSSARRAWSAIRVFQAIASWWNQSADKQKLDTIQENAQANVPTNLGISGSGNSRTITSSTGTNVTVPVATTTVAGLMSFEDKVKVNSVQEGAQVNDVTSVAGKTGVVTLVGTDIPAATTGARGTVALNNTLTSTSTTTALTAAQGRELKVMVDTINGVLNSDDTTLDELQEIVNYIKQNRSTLDALGISNIAGLEAALASKESSLGTGTTGQYLRGDKTWVNLPATNLGQSRNATSYTVTSSTGTNTVLEAATVTNAGVMTAADKSTLVDVDATAVKTSGAQTIAGEKTLSDRLNVNNHIRVNDHYSMVAGGYNAGVTSSELVLLATIKTGGSSRNFMIEGTINGQASANAGVTKLRMTVRSNTLPSKSISPFVQKISIGSFWVDVFVYEDTASDNIYIAATPNATLHNVNFSFDIYSRTATQADVLTVENSKTIFNSAGMTLIENAEYSPIPELRFTFWEYDNGNSGTSKTIDFKNGQKHLLTLTGNCTLTFTNGETSDYKLRIIQDGTGNRSIIWPGNTKFYNGVAPTINTDAGSISIISIYMINGVPHVAGGGFS